MAVRFAIFSTRRNLSRMEESEWTLPEWPNWLEMAARTDEANSSPPSALLTASTSLFMEMTLFVEDTNYKVVSKN